MALEFLSIPAYMMAAWRKRDRKSNEAGVKYYLLGVFSSAVLLYGMSLLYGLADSTRLSDIAKVIDLSGDKVGIQVVAVVFVLIGFAFKISAVPFHSWAPDTYQGAPTPVTAFLSVASKAAGFVGLIALVYLTFPLANDVYRPFLWVLAALTMTVGNLRGPEAEEHRPPAGVLQHQPGWLHPHAAGDGRHRRRSRSRRCVPWSSTSSSTRPRTSVPSPSSSRCRGRPTAVRSAASAACSRTHPGWRR